MKSDRQSRGKRVFPRFSARDDVSRELAAHVAMRAEELVADGWSRDDAEREAKRLLGDRGAIEAECVQIVNSHQRAVRRAGIMEALIQDFRYGLRTILKSPGFALVAIVTLALGIGANAAIFSVVDGVLLEPLPYEDSDELVVVRESRRQGGVMAVAWANFVDWREQNSVFDALFAYTSGSTTVLGGESPMTARVTSTTVGIWSTLGVVPLVGRLTTEQDHLQGSAPVVVVSEGFWRNQLAQRSVEGLVLEISGYSVSVVGVTPATFDFPTGTDVFLPLELGGMSDSRTSHNYNVVARMGDGVALERADEEMNALTQRIVQASGEEESDFLAVGAAVQSLQEQIVGSARTPLLILLGAAALVLLVACTNLASTLLARGSNRAREFAVRSSMGAGQRRLIRQLLTESVVLAVAGAAVGVGLAAGLVAMLKRLGPDAVPRLGEVGIDGTVLLYAVLVSAATVVLFGLYPALRLSRSDAVDVLRSGSRGNAGARRAGAWGLLVGSEVALALILLVGSGLLVRSFQTLLAEDTGIDASDVISTPIRLSGIAYPELVEHVAFYDRLLTELERSPSVSAAAVMTSIPMAGFIPNGRLELDGDLDKHAVAEYVLLSGSAFDALDIPLLQGRVFDRTDTPDQPHVAIVSESFANEYWPDENPIGRRVTGGGMDSFWQDRLFAEVVGVVGDVRFQSLERDPGPVVYFPYTQRPSRLPNGGVVLVEASNGDLASTAPLLRETLQRIDPDVPVAISTQESLITDSEAARAFTMILLTGFSLIALALAVVGIYGVVSYSVARRTREMGIRLALGADPRDVRTLVVKASMQMVVVGLLVGVVGSVAVGGVMRGMLYGVEPGDPFAIVAGIVVLAGAALLASWVPARFGTRLDPMVTMRAD